MGLPNSKWVYKHFIKFGGEGYPAEEVAFLRKLERKCRKEILRTLCQLPKNFWRQLEKGDFKVSFKLATNLGIAAENSDCIGRKGKYIIRIGRFFDPTTLAHELAHAFLKHDCDSSFIENLTAEQYDAINAEADILAIKWGFPVEKQIEEERYVNAWFVGEERRPGDDPNPDIKCINESSKRNALEKIKECNIRLKLIRDLLQ